MISYAQNFEDVVLHRVFHNVENGRYIDVGAFDPVMHSVTKHFYDKGWSGVNIEPVERFFKKFERDRPRDWNINAGIGSEIGKAEFYEWGYSGMSTTREVFNKSAMKELGFERTTKTIALTTLAEITKQLPDREIDFLKIDVEGAERNVLLGGEWKNFRPRVVLLEAIKPKLPGCDPYSFEPTWNEWEDILFQNSYEFALFDGLNRFYYRSEEPALHAPLSYPANVTDGFQIDAGHDLFASPEPTKWYRTFFNFGFGNTKTA